MIRAERTQEDLLRLASDVAEIMRRAHGVDRAPSPPDYRMEAAAPGQAPRIELTVDIGRGLVIPVHLEWREFFNERLNAETLPFAEGLSLLVTILHRQAPELRAVQRMAPRRFAKAAEAAVPCRLRSVTPGRLDADWCSSPRVDIEFEAVDASLRTAVETYCCPSRKDFADFFKRLEATQAARLARRETLARLGATAAIDAVLLRALGNAGVTGPELFGHLRRRPGAQTWIDCPDGSRLRFWWADGLVFGLVALEDGVMWGRGGLQFQNAPRRFDKRDVGRRLVDVYPHPLIPDRITVAEARGEAGGPAGLACSNTLQLLDLEGERFSTSSETGRAASRVAFSQGAATPPGHGRSV